MWALTGMVWLPCKALMAVCASTGLENLTNAQPVSTDAQSITTTTVISSRSPRINYWSFHKQKEKITRYISAVNELHVVHGTYRFSRRGLYQIQCTMYDLQSGLAYPFWLLVWILATTCYTPYCKHYSQVTCYITHYVIRSYGCATSACYQWLSSQISSNPVRYIGSIAGETATTWTNLSGQCRIQMIMAPLFNGN